MAASTELLARSVSEWFEGMVRVRAAGRTPRPADYWSTRESSLEDLAAWLAESGSFTVELPLSASVLEAENGSLRGASTTVRGACWCDQLTRRSTALRESPADSVFQLLCIPPPIRAQSDSRATTGALDKSRGDAYDNALAESVIGLFKTEVIHHADPWKGLDDVELATLAWVFWFNNHRLMEALGYLPPAGYEKQFAFLHAAPAAAQILKPPSLR